MISTQPQLSATESVLWLELKGRETWLICMCIQEPFPKSSLPKAGHKLRGKTGQVKNRQDNKTTRPDISQQRALACGSCEEGRWWGKDRERIRTEPGPKGKVLSGYLGRIRTRGDEGQTVSRGGSNKKGELIQDSLYVKTSRTQGAVRYEKKRMWGPRENKGGQHLGLRQLGMGSAMSLWGHPPRFPSMILPVTERTAHPTSRWS